MILKSKIWLFGFLFFVVLLTSCYKTDPDMVSNELTWNPDLSLPVGTATYSISQKDAENIDVGDFYTTPPSAWYDTLEFNVSEMVDYRENIDSVIFRINLTNEFPAQGEIHVFYPPGNAAPEYEYSLTGEHPIEIAPGEIDKNGEVTIPSKLRRDIPMTSKQIDDLMNSQRLIIRTVVRGLFVTQEIKNNLTKYRFITQVGVRVKIIKVYE